MSQILLLGATGRTGRLVLEKALKHNYTVNCLARASSRLTAREGLTVFEGNPTNADDLSIAMKDCKVVISVLNISRNSDFPWSALRTPKSFMSATVRNISKVAKDHGIKKVIVCSAWGVAESRKDIPFWFRWTIDSSNIRMAYADHEKQELILSSSGLNYVIVRPTGLVNTKKRQKVRESFLNNPKPNLLISRASVASYLVDCIKRDDLLGKKVVISKM